VTQYPGTKMPEKEDRMTKNKSYLHQCQERDVVAFMRDHLSSDGLCRLRTEDIGTAVGQSKTQGIRILRRLRQDQIWVWVVDEAANRDGNQSTYGIFPWRGATRFDSESLPDAAQSVENNQGADLHPYMYKVGHIANKAGYSKSGGCLVNGVVAGANLHPALPPAWALAAQSASAQARLDTLNVRLSSQLDQYGPDAWTTPIQVTSARIDDVQAYIADLNVWKLLAGVQ
jgi:hypothetical protein